MPPRELFEDEPAGVVPRPLVPAPGIAEPRDQEIQRRGTIAPTEEAHLFLARLLLGCFAFALGASLALGTLFALRHLALGQLTLLELLALDLLGLRLDEARRPRHGREHGLLWVVHVGEALAHPQVSQAQRVADRHPADVELEVLGNLHRQRLDGDLAVDLREDTA